MQAINLKKLIQLPIIFMSISSFFIGLNPKSSMAAPGTCQFQVGEDYSNKHSVHQGVLSISDSSSAFVNGTKVNIFSGSWRLQSATEGQPVTIQTAGSSFLMIRDLGEIKQVWAGTCGSDGFARGIVYESSRPNEKWNFFMKSR
jgi:hypothetical protein